MEVHFRNLSWKICESLPWIFQREASLGYLLCCSLSFWQQASPLTFSLGFLQHQATALLVNATCATSSQHGQHRGRRDAIITARQQRHRCVILSLLTKQKLLTHSECLTRVRSWSTTYQIRPRKGLMTQVCVCVCVRSVCVCVSFSTPVNKQRRCKGAPLLRRRSEIKVRRSQEDSEIQFNSSLTRRLWQGHFVWEG